VFELLKTVRVLDRAAIGTGGLCNLTVIINRNFVGINEKKVITYFKALCWHLYGQTEHNHE